MRFNLPTLPFASTLSAFRADAGKPAESENSESAGNSVSYPSVIRLIKWSGDVTTLVWDDGADAAYFAEGLPDAVKRPCRHIEIRDLHTDEGLLMWKDGRWACDILDPRPINER